MDLKTLTEINAPSGYEQPLRRYLLEELQAAGQKPVIDRMGNVVVVREGKGENRKRVMLSAHMDEVGFIVRAATEDGFLKVLPLGGVDPRVIISKRVLVGDDKLPGVIGAAPIHLQSSADRKRVLGYDDVYVDIGAKDKKEAEAKAPVGTQICFDTPYVTYGEGYVCAKALDDRVGIYNLFRLVTAQEEYPCDVVAVFASEEEVGCRGAKGAAFAQAPDVGIALEGTTCNDLGDVPEACQVCRTGDGVAVSFGDGSSLVNRDLFRHTLSIAEEQGLHCQVKGSVSGGNEAGVMQRARQGIPTIVLSVPCRYIHSPSTVCCMQDVEDQLTVARALLMSL
ncbi:MAG: M42 family metallopeptidase [Aristaeellaceae bacterium]